MGVAACHPEIRVTSSVGKGSTATEYGSEGRVMGARDRQPNCLVLSLNEGEKRGFGETLLRFFRRFWLAGAGLLQLSANGGGCDLISVGQDACNLERSIACLHQQLSFLE